MLFLKKTQLIKVGYIYIHIMYIYITFKPCFVVEWVDNWGNSGMQLNNYFCWGNHRIFNGGKNPQIGICCQQNLGFIQGKIGISSLKKSIG